MQSEFTALHGAIHDLMNLKQEFKCLAFFYCFCVNDSEVDINSTIVPEDFKPC